MEYGYWVLGAAALLPATAAFAGEPTASSTGVLLLAHGGRLASWDEEVNRIAAEAA